LISLLQVALVLGKEGQQKGSTFYRVLVVVILLFSIYCCHLSMLQMSEGLNYLLFYKYPIDATILSRT
jgi:hypothetical protein